MKDSFSPTQRLILFNLLFTGEEPAQSKVRPELKPKEREELVRAGLIRLEQRRDGRSRFKALVLTDRAWEWAAESLDSELLVSKYATGGLQAVLRRLKEFLQSRSLTLSDMFHPPPASIDTSHETAAAHSNPVRTEVPLADKIRLAYLALSGGGHRKPIRLADLKAQLSDTAPETVDWSLIHMQNIGELSLQPI
ncbi:MAG: hypothetical protein ACREDR_44610, partial [Blastocatellia bacterium]